jgi:hypothetical protein
MRPFLPVFLLLAAMPAAAQTVAPVTSAPLAAPGMSPPPGPLTRPPSQGAAPALVPVSPPGPAMPPGPAVPLSVAPGAPATPPAGSARLPEAGVSEDAKPSAFVESARAAITAGRIGEATEAIERAESRILSRSVKPSRANDPSSQVLVKQLADARAALAAGDRAAALAGLAAALQNPWIDSGAED